MSTTPRIPTLEELPAAPRRIVLHWTGGRRTPNSVDLAAYHYLVDGEGRIHAGRWSVAANMRAVSGSAYAMHTGGMNSYSVGVAFCGEYSAADRLTETQVRAGLAFAAALCRAWRLDPSDPSELFSHREAWTLHQVRGSTNHTKQDIGRLAFLPGLTPEQVGDWLREQTAEALLDMIAAPPRPPELSGQPALSFTGAPYLAPIIVPHPPLRDVTHGVAGLRRTEPATPAARAPLLARLLTPITGWNPVKTMIRAALLSVLSLLSLTGWVSHEVAEFVRANADQIIGILAGAWALFAGARALGERRDARAAPDAG